MTLVFVSCAEDGEIRVFALQEDGALVPRERHGAGGPVMPMSVSPDEKYLVAAVRSKPYSALTYALDRKSGAIRAVGSGPLAESLPYITHDRTGRYLLGASYGGDLVSVNPVGEDGRLGSPLQVQQTARNAHCIIVDRTNRYAFVPHLGTDQVFQFRFDAKTGRLTPNTPATVQVKANSGPRHIVVSPDNRFLYLLNELTATVVTFSLDAKTGLLTELDAVSALPAGSKLVPGAPRPTPGRDVSNDVWASDLHLTPNGRFLYAAERTGATITGFSVDTNTGKLSPLGSTATVAQPRGFAIDPGGRFMVVSGEKSDHLATYAIAPDGALIPVGRYPTGKGSNWVEIVAF